LELVFDGLRERMQGLVKMQVEEMRWEMSGLEERMMTGGSAGACGCSGSVVGFEGGAKLERADLKSWVWNLGTGISWVVKEVRVVVVGVDTWEVLFLVAFALLVVIREGEFA
jgi:hypothetical protein